jgi:hypothetical protein
MENYCNEIVNIYLFVRNGANMANFIRQMPMRQTKFKIFDSDQLKDLVGQCILRKRAEVRELL